MYSEGYGSRCSDWGWLKASLPSSLGNLNIRQASLHAPAFFIGSVHQSECLICDILSVPASTLDHLPQTICALSKAAGRPDWSIENIDVPLGSPSLSHAIDNACFTALLASSPDIRSRALALSTAIPHAGDLLSPLHPWVSICWALNFTPAYDTGWICGCSRTRFSSQSVMLLPTHWGMGIGIESSDTMHSETQFSQLLSLQQPAS